MSRQSTEKRLPAEGLNIGPSQDDVLMRRRAESVDLCDIGSRQREGTNSGSEHSLEIDEDDRIPTSERLEDELLWYLRKVAKLAIPSTFGFLSEAQDYDVKFLLDSDLVRGAEGSKVDGGLYLGDADLSSSTYARKLDLFSDLISKERLAFAGEDTKSPTQVLEWIAHYPPYLRVIISTKAQGHNAAHFCVHFGGAPGMRVLLPVEKDAQFEWHFGSRLSYHMPLPPRISFLAFPQDSLQDGRKRLKQVYIGEAQQYEVPVSEVLLPPFVSNLSRDPTLLRPDSTANGIFHFLHAEIAASASAQYLNLALDFSRHQPLDGDAVLIRPNDHFGEDIDKLELKDGLIRESEDGIVFSQPLGDHRLRIRHSPFHPLRCDNFVVLFGRARGYVYWVPASRIDDSWWSDAQEVHIARNKIADCRIQISGNAGWFDEAYRRIIKPNTGSMRKKDLRLATNLDHYAVSRKVDDENDLDVKYLSTDMKKARDALKPMPNSPWWNIERANEECANDGYGIWLPLGDRERIAQAVFVGYEWDETDKLGFDSVGRLPAALHTGDLSPHTPCLLMKTLRASKAYGRRNGYPLYVSGLRLDQGPLPCLYLIDCGRPSDRDNPRSNMLVPEEFIDFEYRKQKYTDKLATMQGWAQTVDSAREVINILGRGPGSKITYDTDLRELLTLPCSELMAREYKDQHEAVKAFLAAHENSHKSLTWAPTLDISATGNYVVTMGALQQTFANDWTPTLESAWFVGGGGQEDSDSEDYDE